MTNKQDCLLTIFYSLLTNSILKILQYVLPLGTSLYKYIEITF